MEPVSAVVTGVFKLAGSAVNAWTARKNAKDAAFAAQPSLSKAVLKQRASAVKDALFIAAGVEEMVNWLLESESGKFPRALKGESPHSDMTEAHKQRTVVILRGFNEHAAHYLGNILLGERLFRLRSSWDASSVVFRVRKYKRVKPKLIPDPQLIETEPPSLKLRLYDKGEVFLGKLFGPPRQFIEVDEDIDSVEPKSPSLKSRARDKGEALLDKFLGSPDRFTEVYDDTDYLETIRAIRGLREELSESIGIELT